MNNFYPQTLFDIGSFSGSYRSYPKEKLSDWPPKRRPIEKCLKQKWLKMGDINVRHKFQADQSTFRGLNRHFFKKNHENRSGIPLNVLQSAQKDRLTLISPILRHFCLRHFSLRRRFRPLLVFGPRPEHRCSYRRC